MSKSAITTELKNAGLSPSRPVSPGEVLRDDFLPHLKITQTQLAAALQIPLQRLNLIIHGKRGVTPDTALRLSKVLGPSPKFWLGLQQDVDLYDTIVAFVTEKKVKLKRLAVVASADATDAQAPPQKGRSKKRPAASKDAQPHSEAISPAAASA